MPVSGFVEGWSKADVTYHWSNAETRHISLSDLLAPRSTFGNLTYPITNRDKPSVATTVLT